MSDCSGSPSDHHESQQAPKRKATQAGIDGHPTGRSVKRRASKACQCCRARKVRCNVTEHGAPCTNCRLDEVDCIVSESRRKKSVYNSSPASDGRSRSSISPHSSTAFVRVSSWEVMRGHARAFFEVGPGQLSQPRRARRACHGCVHLILLDRQRLFLAHICTMADFALLENGPKTTTNITRTRM
jgi:hypothetical protein